MFGLKRKHLDILMNRRHATIYINGRYLHIDATLSLKSVREINTLRDLVKHLEDLLASEKITAVVGETERRESLISSI